MDINLKISDPKTQIEQVTGFLGGLNTFQDQTVIKDSELTEAKNVMLTVDGIEPRYGTERLGDDGGASKVYGSFSYHQSDGTIQFLRVANQRLQKLVGTTWTDIGSTVFADADTDFVQAYNVVYIFNGSDNLRSYDGSTVSTYTAISAPSSSLTLNVTGTSGSTNYSYIITAFNSQGETLGSTALTTSSGNATLSTSNYNALSWGAVANADGYNIYGRTATGFGESYMATVYTNSYNDQGQDTPSTTILPPEGNSTAGIKGSMAAYAISRIFVAGNPDNPSRLYWGGLGTNVANFSGALEGGGYTDIYKNDGTEIRAIKAFQDGIVIFKDRAIFKFSFTSDGFPQLQEITRSFGGIAHRSVQHVENDLIFAARKDGRLAFYSLGFQENYSASILRTNELSVKIATKLEEVNVAQLPDSAAFYYRNIYGCAVPKSSSSDNNRIWCLDTRFGAWVYWEGITPNHFSTHDDGATGEKLYFGDESSGYVVEAFKDARNDDGVAIETAWTTKAFDQGTFKKYKEYMFPTFQFKNINRAGAISGDIVLDGAIAEETFTITTVTTNGLGVGVMLPGQFLPGEAYGGTAEDGESADQLIELYKRALKGRSIKYAYRTATKDLQYKFLSLYHEYSIISGKQLKQSSKVY